MAQFEAFEGGVESSGRTVGSVVAGVADRFGVFEKRMNGVLAENDIEDRRRRLDSFEPGSESIAERTMGSAGERDAGNLCASADEQPVYGVAW